MHVFNFMQPSDWIALTALIISLGTALLPRFLTWRRKKHSGVRAFPMGSIELGFSAAGNTIALEGNFRSHDDDFFVHTLEVSVFRSDGERRDFTWSGIRLRKVVASLQPIPQAILSPTGFELKNRSSQYYHLVFSDLEAAAKVSEFLAAIRTELTDKMKSAGIFGPDYNPQSVKDFEIKFLNQLFEEDRFETSASVIRGHCFWLEGRYGLQLRIKTTAPDREFTEAWQFSVTATAATALAENANTLMFNNLNQTVGRLSFPETIYELNSSSTPDVRSKVTPSG